MSYNRATHRCEFCGQKFMSDEIRKMHEKYCEEDDD